MSFLSGLGEGLNNAAGTLSNMVATRSRRKELEEERKIREAERAEERAYKVGRDTADDAYRGKTLAQGDRQIQLSEDSAERIAVEKALSGLSRQTAVSPEFVGRARKAGFEMNVQDPEQLQVEGPSANGFGMGMGSLGPMEMTGSPTATPYVPAAVQAQIEKAGQVNELGYARLAEAERSARDQHLIRQHEAENTQLRTQGLIDTATNNGKLQTLALQLKEAGLLSGAMDHALQAAREEARIQFPPEKISADYSGALAKQAEEFIKQRAKDNFAAYGEIWKQGKGVPPPTYDPGKLTPRPAQGVLPPPPVLTDTTPRGASFAARAAAKRKAAQGGQP